MKAKIKNPQNTLKCCFEWFKTFKIMENGDVTCNDVFDVLIPSNLLLFIQELSPMFFADYVLTDEHSAEMAKGLHFLMDGINDYMDGRFRDEIDTLDYDLIASAIEKKGKVQNEILCEICRVCGFVIVFAVESEYNEDVISNMMILSEDAQIELQHMIQITGEFAEGEEESDEVEEDRSGVGGGQVGISLAHADELERRIDALEKQLKSEQKARQTAEDALKKVSAKPKSAIEETEKLENEVWNLQNEKTQLIKEKKELETKLKGDIKDLQSEIDQYKSEAGKVEGLEQQIKKLKEKVDSLLELKRQNEKLIKQLEELENGGGSGGGGDGGDSEGNKKSTQLLKDRISDLEEEIEKNENEKDELNEQLNKVKQQQEKFQKELKIKQDQVKVLVKLLDDNGISIAGKVDINLEEVESFPKPGTESFYITQLSILTEQLNMQKQLLLSEQKRIQLLESQGNKAAPGDSTSHSEKSSDSDFATISTLKQQIMIREQEVELHLSAKKDIEKRTQMELKLLSTCLHDMALKYHQCKSIIKQLDEELSSLKQKCQISINSIDQESGIYNKDGIHSLNEVSYSENIN
ncbi:uncharacterized protein cubi_01680 [Cryptosporidium ubiquitum]|uniref:Uncharacterized protein n=1 Tax=Cryptosporidium ubiquitum TaxID=857276 RepID=A0A1J4MEQ9_9CRYT|nr:uncharacterized protein cubi_01680 [Cryptosporidium ubiquitum]OII72730.1 hypothetical protein cubi_01680 [Cryptosporidium ubiquitum]